MDIVLIVSLGIIGAVLSLVLRDVRPELALVVSLAAGALILAAVIGKVGDVVAVMGSLAERANLAQGYLSTLLRVVGVAYVAEFGAQACRDAGAGSIAAKVELGGKLIVLAASAPIVAELVTLVLGMLA